MRSGGPETDGATRRTRERRRSAVGAGGRGLLPDGSTFFRGLSIGALVGAAIAGSTIWERWRRRRAVPPSDAPERADERPASQGGPAS